jgi:hypothetical protein
MTALLVVVLSVAALYALIGLYVAYLHACKRATAWATARADARRVAHLTTPQKGETP